MSIQWNVGGNWDFCFDPENEGLQKGWYRNKPQKTKSIKLPHVWSMSPKSSQGSHVAFYYKTFAVDKAESNKRFFIRFDSVHHFATVWLNGEEIGAHLGGHVPFDLDASKHVKIGEENFLAVRVEGPDENGYLDDRPVVELPMGYTYQKAPFNGILGDIHLLMGGRAGIQHLICFPDYEADWVTIEAKFWNPKNYKAELEYTITAPDGKQSTLPKLVKLEKENGTHSLTVSLDKAQVWSPDKPNLYKVKVNLRGSYSMECVFGLRRVEVERCSLKINHHVTKIKGVNYNQVFPFTRAVPPEPIDLEKDLTQIKEAGFNLIRSCGVPLSNQALDVCDRVGLMVIQETTCFNQKSNKDSLEEIKEQLRTLIFSTGYHPSIVMWAVGAENGSMVLENGNKLLRYASELDPYRPIVSNLNSVYMDSNGRGRIDLGKVYDPTEAAITPFESHQLNIAYPVAAATQKLLINYCTSKEAKAVNDGIHGGKSFWERYNYLKDELGGKILMGGLGFSHALGYEKVLNAALSKKNQKEPEVAGLTDYKNQIQAAVKKIPIWKTTQEFLEQTYEMCLQALAQQIDAYLINTQISGYLFEQWADQGNNMSGLVDWYRRPKPLLGSVQQLNQKIRVLSEAEDRTPYMGTSAAMNIYLLNDGGLGEYGLLLRVKGPNGRIWHQESMPGKASRSLNSLGRFKFPVGFEKGWFTFDLTLTEGKKELAKREEVFFVPPKVELDPLLNQLNFLGSFSEAITYGASRDAKIILIHRPQSVNQEDVQAAFKKAREEGATVVLGSLEPEDVEALKPIVKLPAINCFRSSWAEFGSYHYAQDSEDFKELPTGLLNHAYADVLPRWSLVPDKSAVSPAGSISFTDGDIKEQKVALGMDIAEWSLGKGRLVVHQFQIFDKLGTNALADILFYNLITRLQKKKK